MSTARLVAALFFAGWAGVACGDEMPEQPPGPLPPGAPPSDAGTDVAERPQPSSDATSGAAYEWDLPAWFPKPAVPADNPMSAVKVELGRHLFYDVRLSLNQTQSCASCHEQALAFTDGLARAVGSTGEQHPRNSMTLANVAYFSSLTWANPLLSTLEQQALVPLFGDDPVELGMRNQEDELLRRLNADSRYQRLFPRSFPETENPITIQNMVRAISAFQRTIVSATSPFDRFSREGQADAISDSAKRGFDLFNSEKLECFHCHNGFSFVDSIHYEGKRTLEMRFHNTGLYNIDGRGGYPAPNRGVIDVTEKPDDMGAFRAQSLRNIAVTAPYMHDGSIATLDEVLDHYAAAGRTLAGGPHAGVGSANPYKSEFLVGFELSAQERADVLAFLHSLTDAAFLTDPKYADPWPKPCEWCEP